VENLLKGVYKRVDSKGNERFVASFTYKNKHISLGSFDSEKAANSAYKEAVGLTTTERHKTIDDYDETATLDFEKWVTIVNFRDNGLYVKNPIYLRRRYFEYYLSTTDVMKFSAEGGSATEYKKLSDVPGDKIIELRTKEPAVYRKLYKAEYGVECELED